MRRLLPGFAVSLVGDGMSALAVSWLAIEIAPQERHALWVSLAVAAYTFPGVIGTFLFAGPLRGRSGAQLVTWDSTLRAVSLGAIAAAAQFGSLDIRLFIGLLAVSSLLHSWGSAGTYTLMADLLPERDHVPGNALLSLLTQVGVLLGPMAAGLLVAAHGAGLVVALDAASFALLAISCRLVAPPKAPAAAGPGPSRSDGFRRLRADRQLLSLTLLTFLFYGLYGPIQVALPVWIADQNAPPSHLAWYFTAFGAGAISGGLVAGYLRGRPLWPMVAFIVTGAGFALLPLGLGAPVPVSVAGFAVAGFIIAPFGSITVARFQSTGDPRIRAPLLAARHTVIVLAGPAGVGAGGLLVTLSDVQTAMLVSSGGTLLLGIAVTVVVARTRKSEKAPLPTGS